MDNGSDLSQRVLRAAKKLFFVRGFDDTQLWAIAAEAGTSESGILRVYHSKSGLLRAVYASCWAETNAYVDRAMVAAVERDPDPRNLLLELLRAVLELYETDTPMMEFVLGHFGFRETTGLGAPIGVDAAVDAQVRSEYHRYLDRIEDLCIAVQREDTELAAAGVTPRAFAEIMTSIIYGIQTGWYMAGQEAEATASRVTIPEVLAAVSFLLYPKKSVDGGTR
ncbi:MAG: TetR/AcrR family transcriptional regulator [Thermoleophilia bacterium]|nr:TetR/AcrR family transcriptional regulator [Thermoleophilia bacterium]